MAKASASDDWSHVKLVKTGRRMLIEKINLITGVSCILLPFPFIGE